MEPEGSGSRSNVIVMCTFLQYRGWGHRGALSHSTRDGGKLGFKGSKFGLRVKGYVLGFGVLEIGVLEFKVWG
jgi:hypothetical protein